MDLGVVIGGDLRGLALPMVDRVIPRGTWVGAPPERIAQNHRAITETFAPTGR
jgi:hypothetical protein